MIEREIEINRLIDRWFRAFRGSVGSPPVFPKVIRKGPTNVQIYYIGEIMRERCRCGPLKRVVLQIQQRCRMPNWKKKKKKKEKYQEVSLQQRRNDNRDDDLLTTFIVFEE